MGKGALKVYTGKEFYKLTVDTLVECKSIDLLILKGHVLVEYIFNMSLLINSKSVDNDYIDRMAFSQKQNLLNKLILEEPLSKQQNDDINLLNQLRNDIAHRLTYNKQHLQAFLKRFDEITVLKNFNNNDIAYLFQSLIYLLATLYVSLITTRLVHKKAINNLEAEIVSYLQEHLSAEILKLKITLS